MSTDIKIKMKSNINECRFHNSESIGSVFEASSEMEIIFEFLNCYFEDNDIDKFSSYSRKSITFIFNECTFSNQIDISGNEYLNINIEN